MHPTVILWQGREERILAGGGISDWRQQLENRRFKASLENLMKLRLKKTQLESET